MDVMQVMQENLRHKKGEDVARKLIQEISAVKDMQQIIHQKMNFVAQLAIEEFKYTIGKCSGSCQAGDFKEELQDYYDNQPAEEEYRYLRCMLLDVALPLAMVTGAHLFKYCWRAKMNMILELSNINHPRNGLLLCKGLEHAFDDSRICFLCESNDEGVPKFILELLDLSLENTTLWEYMKGYKLTKYKPHQFQEDDEPNVALLRTFGQLKGKALTFTNRKYPYKRCLAFQARQAVRRAREEGWLPDNWQPAAALTCASEEARERLDTWLNMAVEAPAPMSESTIIDDDDKSMRTEWGMGGTCPCRACYP
ncbi:hypothetical protein Vretimale_12316 [Volvox reticuliferus]|uniref:HNH nuclease domain-containing protein n=2 Tax=Volvox reticuliferus TaxID=1737510 RepID=A0A8J4LSC9_9CHLO|nr:hypothetical protein Vretimale_12316 [Volvox reticuliferus]